uniref:Polypeptide N-acetylgalactosaminyltransferase 11-like n=1 Tax=Dermatophagoides pteronyssinus TaxID=6956 RepID=A0A6P6Y611_DERPT|nr:polypeptide N-acetylgalactosaminyltransferase 11-like [Dermatophagoides pteronyssinus]
MLSDALPLDRAPPDQRSAECKAVKYDLEKLSDVSVIITFYNEPFSTLFRTVHSVLNHTPPELLREIILVDDGSNFVFHSQFDEHATHLDYHYYELIRRYIDYLPKVHLTRLARRQGLVKARMAGINQATADVFMILDSHVEVGEGWLEPILQTIHDDNDALVIPHIYSISAKDFSYLTNSGIGCQISFKWDMTELSSFEQSYPGVTPILSPSLSGGLFAVHKETFLRRGAFDMNFEGWGSENVELGFRWWMCGGKVAVRNARIVCTQPRRIAAVGLARFVGQRVAADSQLSLRAKRGASCAGAAAKLVGHSIRFESTATRDTRLLYATDGVLLKQFMENLGDDGELQRLPYDYIIIDEAHERSVRIDLLLQLLKRLKEVDISQAAAEQRAGRAGRTAPGTVFRLYTS